MRDFSWKYFAMTGDVESYLLYKAFDPQNAAGVDEWDEEELLEEEPGYAVQ
jgi:hypothetical protein